MCGYDYIHPREDICCYSWRYEGNNLNYSLLTDEDYESEDEYISKCMIFMDETPYDYCATVNVDVNTGEVTRDYENSRLPSYANQEKD